MQRTDTPSQFWLSGYSATATGSGESLTFTAESPLDYEVIDIEAIAQPGGGKFEIRLDGNLQTTYDLAAGRIGRRNSECLKRFSLGAASHPHAWLYLK